MLVRTCLYWELACNHIEMPKRSRADSADEKEPAGKEKVVNVAYGEVNKAGISIPAQSIDRPKLTVAADERLTVVTWNLNGMRSFVEKKGEVIKKLFDEEHVDILAVTEHKITDDARANQVEADLKKVLKGHDVKVIWNMCTAKKGYAGTCAIVRSDVHKRIRKTTFGYGATDTEGRVITLDFDSMSVVVVYVPNSGMTLDRLQWRTTSWDKDFGEYCHTLSKSKPLVIAGDLNVAIRDCDIWNVDAAHIPKLAGTTPQERHSFQTRFLDKGLLDTFAAANPDKTGWFSYWSVKAGNKPKNRGLRLDYVLADKKVKVLDAFISPEYAPTGDHCPCGIVIHASRASL